MNKRPDCINTFDIDGVINMDMYDGIYPGPDDIIITGRSIEEYNETRAMLDSKGITNQVFMQNIPFDQKTREGSGKHKGEIIKMLLNSGIKIGIHFEDDPIQIHEIQKLVPSIHIVHVNQNLVTKENIRHDDYTGNAKKNT